MHRSYLFGFIKAPDAQFYRLEKEETIRDQWKVQLWLIAATLIAYIVMSLYGMGTESLSDRLTELSTAEYVASQFWFVIGRMVYALILAIGVLYLVSYYFYLWTKIPYKKLVLMQQVALFAIIIERILWIPLFVIFGVDWNMSPMSFGVIAVYLTDHQWLINPLGALSVIQIWIAYFQGIYLRRFATLERWQVWLIVVGLHLFIYIMIGVLTYALEGWV
ncbi:hypothetical protein ABID56_001158 [Alkalibacillus flavidus]|uniref:Yip1 domain-containing protein n=1 Tax=Alkalibacillus flavidus TaxID=546021 RepID=A0ABV2KU07_9BACI